MSVYEDGKEVRFHEADITLPENVVSLSVNFARILRLEG